MVRLAYFCLTAVVSNTLDQCAAFVAPTIARPGATTRYARPFASGSAFTAAIHHGTVSRGRCRVDSCRRQSGFSMQQEPSKWGAGGVNVSGEAPFEIRGFSLANAAAAAGVAITAASFFEYFSSGGSGGLSGIGFVYGIPIALIGLALKYAELSPAPLQTTPEAEALFEEKATDTLRAIKKDVTRHRYGDEAHLDTTVKTLGLVMPQSDYPQLQYITQTVEPNGELGFSMVFQSKMTPFKRWVEPDRIEKYVNFFGPGVDAEVIKVNREEKLVAIKLTTLPPGVEPKSKVPEPAAVESPGAEAAAEPAAPATEAQA